ncbi:MAG: hypothetical protein PHP98_00375 [Kiritimatiellae bacterium]|jgi:predicted transcriptional regulator of viral defense system|nr:hypothetical protein [Kiritimatiellia bacterium]
MRRISVLAAIRKLGRRVFCTREISMSSGKSLSAVTQALNNLVREGLAIKIYRGVWALENDEPLSACAVVPYLFPWERVYVSFISALHLHGMIEQIPQIITLASTSHSKIIRTKLGVFQTYHISPSFFAGFGWYKNSNLSGSGQGFLIAEPEKALADSLYLSAYKQKRFRDFPEIYFPRSFSFKRARSWADKINSKPARIHARKVLEEIRLSANQQK